MTSRNERGCWLRTSWNVAQAVLLCAACHQKAQRHEITVGR